VTIINFSGFAFVLIYNLIFELMNLFVFDKRRIHVK